MKKKLEQSRKTSDLVAEAGIEPALIPKNGIVLPIEQFSVYDV